MPGLTKTVGEGASIFSVPWGWVRGWGKGWGKCVGLVGRIGVIGRFLPHPYPLPLGEGNHLRPFTKTNPPSYAMDDDVFAPLRRKKDAALFLGGYSHGSSASKSVTLAPRQILNTRASDPTSTTSEVS